MHKECHNSVIPDFPLRNRNINELKRQTPNSGNQGHEFDSTISRGTLELFKGMNVSIYNCYLVFFC